MSLAEKARTKPERFTNLVTWLETLPKTEHEGAIYMLSQPTKWSTQAVLDEFRADALAERNEELAFGKDQVAGWRRVHGVSR